jgi:hypothetical protein
MVTLILVLLRISRGGGSALYRSGALGAGADVVWARNMIGARALFASARLMLRPGN